jgi:Ribbon-helix-helix protein, copG family
MAITRRPSKAEEAFTAGAPDAGRPAPWNVKLRGRRQPLTFTLPPELVARIDAVASEERRSRAKMIEIALEDFLERRQQQQAA